MNEFPMIIAHRGASTTAPENTLPAFKKAIEMDCDAIELDVHLSKDHRVVVIHDNTLNRTTNGVGLVSGYTLSELKTFDAGKRFSNEFEGTRIPTLDEVFEFISTSEIKVIIELKGNYTRLEKKVASLINEFKYEKRTIISSMNHRYFRNVKESDPSIILEADFLWTFQNIVEYARKMNVDILCPIHYFVEQMPKRHIRKLSHNGIKLFTYTVNDEASMLHLVRKGVDGIMTDRPDLLMEIKKNHNPEKIRSLGDFIIEFIKR